MLDWMAYSVVLTALVGSAAWAIEASVRGRGIADRWIWVSAMLGAAGIAALGGWGELASRSGIAPVGMATGYDAADAQRAGAVARLSPAIPLRLPGLPRALTPLVAVAWGLASAGLAVGLLIAMRHLRRARRTWIRAEVEGREVLVSSVVGPAVTGFRHPQIVLPRWCLDMPPDDRDLMLRHEEEHRRARDVTLLGTAQLLLVALPWNPVLWWLVRRLHAAVELDCDRRVLAQHVDVVRYATLLIEVSHRRAALPVGSLALGDGTSLIERRVRVICGKPRPTRFPRSVFAVMGLAFVVAACRLERAPPSAPGSGTARIPPPSASPAGGENGRVIVHSEAIVTRSGTREVVFTEEPAEGPGGETARWWYVESRPLGPPDHARLEIFAVGRGAPPAPGDAVLVGGESYLSDAPVFLAAPAGR